MRQRRTLVCVAVLLLSSGCLEATSAGDRDTRLKGDQEGEPVLQSELQQDVQRFTGQFMDRLADATEPLAQDEDPGVRRAAQHFVLLDMSAALDIATGPLPEINVLDMLVYLTLEIDVLERYWVPEVFGKKGQPLTDAFVDSEQKMWTIAAKVMRPAQEQELRATIREWQNRHPNQNRVEAVRFTDFSARAGEVAAERARHASGLLGSVKGATQAADQALLLADRALFLVHRMPFLIRLQARVGVQESISDTLFRFKDWKGLDALLAQVPQMRPLVQEMSGLVANSEGAMREGRLLAQSLDPLLSYATTPSVAEDGTTTTRLNAAIDASNRLADKTLRIVTDLQQLTAASGGDPLQVVTERIDGMVRRWILYLAALGAAWALFFWTGYYLVKR